MKKGISILFALVIVLSGTHLTLAKHFCGGEHVNTKISLSGKFAGCGMETDKEINLSTGSEIKTHCCENKVSTIGIINNYIPEVPLMKANIDFHSSFFAVPLDFSICSQFSNYNISPNIRPPGNFPATLVTLNDICVFRI